MSDEDLVQQLRLEKRALTWRAADAIERLTQECEKAFTAMRVFERYRELEAQIAATTTRAEAAERKVEKLREALNFYARHSTYRTCTIYMSGAREKTNAERDCGEIARAALAETENGDDGRAATAFAETEECK